MILVEIIHAQVDWRATLVDDNLVLVSITYSQKHLTDEKH